MIFPLYRNIAAPLQKVMQGVIGISPDVKILAGPSPRSEGAGMKTNWTWQKTLNVVLVLWMIALTVMVGVMEDVFHDRARLDKEPQSPQVQRS